MDAQHLRVFAKEFLVGLNSQCCKFAVCAHLPCGIALALYDLGTSQLEHSLDGGSLVVECAHHVGTLRAYHLGFLLTSDDAGHVVRGFYEPSHSLVLAHGKHAVVDGLHGLHQTCAHILRQHGFSIGALQLELHGLLCDVVFFFHFADKYVPVGTHVLLFVLWYGKHDDTVARNGIV